MNPAYLVLVNVVLLARLAVLFKDDALTLRPWVIKTLVETIALAALFPLSACWGAAAGTIVGFNFLGWRWEKIGRRKNLGRLLLGGAELVALSFCFTPSGLALRPVWATWGPQWGEFTALAPVFSLLTSGRLHVELFGLLLAANEANLAIRAAFDLLDLKPRAFPAGQGAIDVGEFNRGRVIGMLERTLLYLFILQGQYGAIGFILAAKAFTRFKALDDRPFAEYVLIGTLLSACLALGIGAITLRLLR